MCAREDLQIQWSAEEVTVLSGDRQWSKQRLAIAYVRTAVQVACMVPKLKLQAVLFCTVRCMYHRNWSHGGAQLHLLLHKAVHYSVRQNIELRYSGAAAVLQMCDKVLEGQRRNGSHSRSVSRLRLQARGSGRGRAQAASHNPHETLLWVSCMAWQLQRQKRLPCMHQTILSSHRIAGMLKCWSSCHLAC